MNLKTLTKRIFLLDAHYPRSIIAFIILCTIFFIWKIPNLEIDPGLRSLVPEDHKIVKNMELAEDLFSSNEIIIIASFVRPSPNAATESITDNGPKNTRPNVAIASANQALGLTIIGFELCVHIKHTSQNFLK